MRGQLREMGGVRVLVLREEWESGETKFLGTTFAFRRADRFLTAAHCVRDHPPEALLIVDIDGPMPPVAVEGIALHPEADVAVLVTGPVQDNRHAFFYDTHDQFAPGDDFVALGYPSELSAPSPGSADIPVGRIFRGHFQRFFRYSSHFDSCRFVAGEMSVGAPRGLSGGPVLGRDPGMVLGIVTGNMESRTEVRNVAELHDGETHYKEVEAHIINYGVALLLNWVRPFLDEHAPPSA